MKYDTSYEPPAPVIRVRIVNLATPNHQVRDIPALIDSGADMSVVPSRLAKTIALVPKGIVEVQGYRIEKVEHRPKYFVRIEFDRHAVELSVVGDECSEVLLGRDFLRHFVLRLDGPRQEFTLEPDRSSRNSE